MLILVKKESEQQIRSKCYNLALMTIKMTIKIMTNFKVDFHSFGYYATNFRF